MGSTPITNPQLGYGVTVSTADFDSASFSSILNTPAKNACKIHVLCVHGFFIWECMMHIFDLRESGEWVYQNTLYICETIRRNHTFSVSQWISDKDGSLLFVVSDEYEEIFSMFTDYETAKLDAENWAYTLNGHSGG